MSLIVVEYACDYHGRFELLEERAAVPDKLSCPTCGELAELVISAPCVKVQYGAVTQGKPEAPPHPLALDTRELGDGMPVNEWRQKQAKLAIDVRRKRLKEQL